MLYNLPATIVIVAVLMLLDYFLTLKSFKMYKKKFSKHVEFESYELNPVFRKSVKKMKYNYKHLLGIFLTSLMLSLVYLSSKLLALPALFYVMQGYAFSLFAYMNIRHVQNLLTFRALAKDPKILKGKIRYSLKFSLRTAAASSFSLSLFLFFLLIFSPSWFLFGAALAPVMAVVKLTIQKT